MNKIILGFLVGGALAGSVQASQAVSVTFAQFTQSVTANQFAYTAAPGSGLPGTANPGVLTGVSGSIPVSFQFNSFLNGELAGNNVSLFQGYSAILTLTGIATAGESAPFSNNNNFDSMTFTFVADNSAANIAAGIAGKVLLMGTSGGATTQNAGTLTAADAQSSAGFKASNANGGGSTTGNMVNYTSAVIDTSALNTQNYALSFSSVANPNGGITYDPNAISFVPRSLESFTASGTGTFAATFTPVPEPGTYALAGSLLIGGVFSLRRRNRK